MWGEKPLKYSSFSEIFGIWVTVFWFLPHFKQFSHFGILIMTSDDVLLFCIDCVVQSIAVRKVIECVPINIQSTHVHPRSPSTSSSCHCVVNAANDRYFVFFLLGPLILSLSWLWFKKGKRKGNIHQTWGRGGMPKRPQVACFPSWYLPLFTFVSCCRCRSRNLPL